MAAGDGGQQVRACVVSGWTWSKRFGAGRGATERDAWLCVYDGFMRLAGLKKKAC